MSGFLTIRSPAATVSEGEATEGALCLLGRSWFQNDDQNGELMYPLMDIYFNFVASLGWGIFPIIQRWTKHWIVGLRCD